jgi:hypothetical protein
MSKTLRNTHKRLKPCPNCQEASVASKTYVRKKDKQKMCVEFCLNGCGYTQSHPVPLVIHNADGISIVNIIHKDYADKGTELPCGLDEGSCPYVNVDCGNGYCVREDQTFGG